MRVLDYLVLGRYHRPGGAALLFWPCSWSMALASSQGHLDTRLLASFAVGALVMRGAGCTINDIWDREYDRRVVRTMNRPLAAGKLTVPQAIGFLGVQLGMGLGVLLTLNPYTIRLGVASLGLVAVYPLMKRVTWFPQLVLGVTFNWGALMGWAAVHGKLEVAPVCLYGAAICWTMVYDTIYAHQDKMDDEQVGVLSTARYFGERTVPVLAKWATGMLVGLTAAGAAAGAHGMGFYGIAVGGTAVHLYWQLKTLRIHDPQDCNRKFQANNLIGPIVLAGILASEFPTVAVVS
jgi:4-hydroxybenzoate polyprenyltransferase